jgi:hypothetical protein
VTEIRWCELRHFDPVQAQAKVQSSIVLSGTECKYEVSKCHVSSVYEWLLGGLKVSNHSGYWALRTHIIVEWGKYRTESRKALYTAQLRACILSRPLVLPLAIVLWYVAMWFPSSRVAKM